MTRKDKQWIDENVDTSNDDALLNDTRLEALIDKNKKLTEKDFDAISKLIYGMYLAFQTKKLKRNRKKSTERNAEIIHEARVVWNLTCVWDEK